MKDKSKKQNKIWRYISNGGLILLYNLIFSLFGLVFLIDAIPIAVRVVFGFVFMIPPMILVFMLGRSVGEKEYKERNKKNAADGKSFYAVEINYGISGLYLLSFVVPIILLLFIGVGINNTIVHGVVYIVLMPASLVFATLGVITVAPITWLSVAVYLPYLFLICAAFCVGFVLKVYYLKTQQRNIESELRMFNN